MLHLDAVIMGCNFVTRGPGGLALAQFAKPFFGDSCRGDEFVEPETCTYFYMLYI